MVLQSHSLVPGGGRYPRSTLLKWRDRPTRFRSLVIALNAESPHVRPTRSTRRWAPGTTPNDGRALGDTSSPLGQPHGHAGRPTPSGLGGRNGRRSRLPGLPLRSVRLRTVEYVRQHRVDDLSVPVQSRTTPRSTAPGRVDDTSRRVLLVTAPAPHRRDRRHCRAPIRSRWRNRHPPHDGGHIDTLQAVVSTRMTAVISTPATPC